MALLGYKLYATAAIAQAQADALWTRYSAAERAARGLAAGASLDRSAGRAVAPVTVRFALPITAAGETRAALPIDAFALAQNGRVVGGTTIDTSAPVAASALPAALRDAALPPARPGADATRASAPR